MQTKRPSKKLSDKFDGPFPITKIVSPHVYKLELLHDWTIHPVFHTNLLRPGSDDLLPGQLTTPPPPVFIIDDEGQDTWEVTKILNFSVTTSVLDKEGLPRNVCKNSLGKTFRWNVAERSYVADIPYHIYMSLPRR